MKLKNYCCPEILIVDDIDYNRFALGLIIKQIFDLSYLEATNGKECINLVEQYNKKNCCEGIRLIIMDYEMPVLNGV